MLINLTLYSTVVTKIILFAQNFFLSKPSFHIDIHTHTLKYTIHIHTQADRNTTIMKTGNKKIRYSGRCCDFLPK